MHCQFGVENSLWGTQARSWLCQSDTWTGVEWHIVCATDRGKWGDLQKAWFGNLAKNAENTPLLNDWELLQSETASFLIFCCSLAVLERVCLCNSGLSCWIIVIIKYFLNFFQGGGAHENNTLIELAWFIIFYFERSNLKKRT
jgi:hypothetical protein